MVTFHLQNEDNLPIEPVKFLKRSSISSCVWYISDKTKATCPDVHRKMNNIPLWNALVEINTTKCDRARKKHHNFLLCSQQVTNPIITSTSRNIYYLLQLSYCVRNVHRKTLEMEEMNFFSVYSRFPRGVSSKCLLQSEL